ncbi:hypothetical protein BJ742DRAFT_866658 [Cladochytrium replicatum]|nr:hypothetical protein BJ742DRAFT_866658 [Cladochytrium replicatum]
MHFSTCSFLTDSPEASLRSKTREFSRKAKVDLSVGWSFTENVGLPSVEKACVVGYGNGFLVYGARAVKTLPGNRDDIYSGKGVKMLAADNATTDYPGSNLSTGVMVGIVIVRALFAIAVVIGAFLIQLQHVIVEITPECGSVTF